MWAPARRGARKAGEGSSIDRWMLVPTSGPKFPIVYFFNPAIQFNTTVIGGDALSSSDVLTRKR